MDGLSFEERLAKFQELIGVNSGIKIKYFYIGKVDLVRAALIYIDGLISKDIIDRDILFPLMNNVEEDICLISNVSDYVTKKYIYMSNTELYNDINQAVENIRRGKSAVLIDCAKDIIIVDTTGGAHRAISEPDNETALRGSREGFVENLDVNISMLRRKIKDKRLAIEMLTVGKRSKTDIAIIYLEDVAKKKIVDEVKKRINAIDVDIIHGDGTIEQCIEDHPWSVFPQMFGTNRPDVMAADIMEGKIAIITSGTPFVLCAPSNFIQFFQGVEDYHQRTIVASFARILRMLAVFIVITLPSIYLTLVKFNAELIPIKFITPIIQARSGIALTPFLEILLLEIIVEFLREGGLRLPSKIGQTLSVVGGIIIGDTAIKSKIVSPTTLLIIGISVVATFLIPNYDMSLVIRILRFPMLLLANTLGLFGIAAGWFFLMVQLCSMDSFGVAYLEFTLSDMKDIFIRAPLWAMNKRPDIVPNNNKFRQNNFRYKFKKKGNKNEQSE